MLRNPLFNQRINQWVLFLIPLAFMIVNPWPLSELSLWIGYGERLWNDWHFLYKDTVSFLPTDNNTTPSWLISLVYFGLYRVGGIYLVSHFHHLVLILILAFIYRETIFRNSWPWLWQERVAIYAMWLGSGAYFSLRPALLAFIPFLLAYRILERRGSGESPFQRKDWVQLILLQVLWVNLHGSFVLLPVMLAWVLLMKRPLLKNYWLGFGAVVLGTLINPFGFSIYEYVFKTKEYSLLLGISEWLPATSLVYPLQLVCFWVLFFFIMGLLLKSLKGKRRNLRSPLIPLVILPFFSLRLSAFAFCALPLFLLYRGHLFKTRKEDIFKTSPVGPTLAFILILAFTIAGSPYFKDHIQRYLPAHLQSRFDSASVFLVAERIQQSKRSCPILNDFNVGGFLMMKIQNPLLMDGRVTPFTKESLNRYLAFMNGQDIGTLIQQTKPCFAVLSLQSSGPLIEELMTKFQFKNLGAENEYILLEKEEKKN